MYHGATPLTLTRIIELLSLSSYHFADDSAKEWGKAREALASAAKLIAQHDLGYTAILTLYQYKPQLVGLDQVIDTVMQTHKHDGA